MNESDPDKRSVDELIDAGSLGTSEAKALRASVPERVIARVLSRADELERADADFVGHGCFDHAAVDDRPRSSTRVPPRFCPGCAAPLVDVAGSCALMPIGVPAGRSGDYAELGPDDPWGWDCYCAACGWSGDISPDEEVA